MISRVGLMGEYGWGLGFGVVGPVLQFSLDYLYFGVGCFDRWVPGCLSILRYKVFRGWFNLVGLY